MSACIASHPASLATLVMLELRFPSEAKSREESGEIPQIGLVVGCQSSRASEIVSWLGGWQDVCWGKFTITPHAAQEQGWI